MKYSAALNAAILVRRHSNNPPMPRCQPFSARLTASLSGKPFMAPIFIPPRATCLRHRSLRGRAPLKRPVDSYRAATAAVAVMGRERG